jgi:proteasome lid subunit RPN8/RPN11
MTKKNATRPLRLTAYAWAKLLRLRDLGDTEVGGFGISVAHDLLLIEDVCLVKQLCTAVTVKFDDHAVADFFDAQVDKGLPPERFGRIWIHTHPGNSADPSGTDEKTFSRCFGSADWAVMFILACGGRTYARLRFRAGPSGQMELPVEVDFEHPFPAADPVGWDAEYQQSVVADDPFTQRIAVRDKREPSRLFGERDLSTSDSFLNDPYLDDRFWEDSLIHPFLETFDERFR